jgi:SLA1 homology domain 1, SHD1
MVPLLPAHSPRPLVARLALALTLCLGLSARATHELREWKDAQGRPVLARFVELKGGVVVLEKDNGAKSTVPLMRLSAPDQALAKELGAAAAASATPTAPGTAKPDAAGKDKDKNNDLMTLPATVAEIAYLPGSANNFDGFYVHKPATPAERKIWPTLVVFPSHGGAQAEIARYQKAADEAGWLVVFGNDSLGAEPDIRKRSASFVARVFKHLPVDKRRFYLAGGAGAFFHIPAIFELEKKLSATGLLATGGAGFYGNTSITFPKDTLLYVVSPAGTLGRYGSVLMYEKADNKASKLIFNKGQGEATASQIRDALVYMNGWFYRTATGKSPEFKAERDAYVEAMLKEATEKKDFDFAWASELAHILEGYQLLPDQMKKVKELIKEIESKEEVVKFRKYEKDLDKYVSDHLGKGYDEKKIDDQLKKMAKDAEKLAEKHKDVKASDMFKALADKPTK